MSDLFQGFQCVNTPHRSHSELDTLWCFYTQTAARFGLQFYSSKTICAKTNVPPLSFSSFVVLVCHVTSLLLFGWHFTVLEELQSDLWGLTWWCIYTWQTPGCNASQTASWGGLSIWLVAFVSASWFMWLSINWIAIQSSKTHFNATCKMGNRFITLSNYYVCMCGCVCVRNKCFHIAVMNFCVSAGTCVCMCESRFISVWAWVFVHDWLLCLSDHNWKEIHLSLCLSFPLFLCDWVSLSTQFHLKRSFSSLSCLCWSQQAQYITV